MGLPELQIKYKATKKPQIRRCLLLRSIHPLAVFHTYSYMTDVV